MLDLESEKKQYSYVMNINNRNNYKCRQNIKIKILINTYALNISLSLLHSIYHICYFLYATYMMLIYSWNTLNNSEINAKVNIKNEIYLLSYKQVKFSL